MWKMRSMRRLWPWGSTRGARQKDFQFVVLDMKTDETLQSFSKTMDGLKGVEGPSKCATMGMELRKKGGLLHEKAKAIRDKRR